MDTKGFSKDLLLIPMNANGIKAVYKERVLKTYEEQYVIKIEKLFKIVEILKNVIACAEKNFGVDYKNANN